MYASGHFSCMAYSLALNILRIPWELTIETRSRGGLEARDVSVTMGQTAILKGVDLDIAPGKFIALLGPSGCGKTTLLRVLAGLQEVSGGVVFFEGKNITSAKPAERNCGMVFQSLALFPHLNVVENVMFPLKKLDLTKAERLDRALSLLEMVHMVEFRDRPMSRISGGQAQRVAIARALAQEPKLLLLDEPFSALDAELREELRTEIRVIQRNLGISVVMVTHDQNEAFTVSDVVGVMNNGKMEQVGTPDDLMSKPTSSFVAKFVGQRNHISCFYRADGLYEAGTNNLVSHACSSLNLSRYTKYDLYYSSEAITTSGQIEVDALYYRNLGGRNEICARYKGQTIWIDNLWSGQPHRVSFGVDLSASFIFEANDEE